MKIAREGKEEKVKMARDGRRRDGEKETSTGGPRAFKGPQERWEVTKARQEAALEWWLIVVTGHIGGQSCMCLLR